MKQEPLPQHQAFSNCRLYLLKDQASRQERRSKLREAIKTTLVSKGFEPDKNLLDLTEPPSSKDCAISISHTDLFSGFVLDPSASGLGLDIELEERISTKIVQRISNSEEIQMAPDAKFLFPCKEAAWKGHSSLQKEFPTISQIRIATWKKLEENTWTFLTHTHSNDRALPGQGILWKADKILFTLFRIAKPS